MELQFFLKISGHFVESFTATPPWVIGAVGNGAMLNLPDRTALISTKAS